MQMLCSYSTNIFPREEVSVFMKTAIEQARSMLDTLPADASFEDIQYHLYVIQKIERGLTDVDEGNVVEHEQVVSEIKSWSTK